MLMQWSEERLALAQSLLGLLELHLTQANKDITAFDSELQVCHVPHPFCITSLNLHDLQVYVCFQQTLQWLCCSKFAWYARNLSALVLESCLLPVLRMEKDLCHWAGCLAWCNMSRA